MDKDKPGNNATSHSEGGGRTAAAPDDDDATAARNPILNSNPFATYPNAPVANAAASSGINDPFDFGAALIMTAIQTRQPPSIILQTINDNPEELRIKSKFTIKNNFFSIQKGDCQFALHWIIRLPLRS